MWFQIILLLVFAAIAVYLLRATPSPRHLAVRRLLVFAALIAGVVVVLAPGVLSSVARVVGVGRGTDLLFYLAIVAGLIYIVAEYKRSVQQQKAISSLARQLALTEARLADRISELDARGPETPAA